MVYLFRATTSLQYVHIRVSTWLNTCTYLIHEGGKGLTVTNVAISHCPPGHRGASLPHVLNQLVVVCEWERDIILQREEKSQQLLKAQICGKLSYSCHFSLVSVNKWRESSELNWVEIYPSPPIPPLAGQMDGE